MRRVTGVLTLLACLAVPAPVLADHPPVETGTFGAIHKDGFGKGPTEFDYTLKQGDRTIDVRPTRLGAVGDGDRVAVEGREEDGTVVGEVTRRGPEPSVWHGERQMAVVLLNWQDNPAEPWTEEQVREAIFTGPASMNAFYKAETYDKISFAGDVLGWYTLDAPSAGCDFNNWTWKATTAAQEGGTPLDAYTHVMFIFPPNPDCGWGGLGVVGGGWSWINGTLDTYVTAHEMGHNLGLHHANGLSCTSGGNPVSFSDTCVNQEYNDPLDVMGSSRRHSHGWHLERLGVLAPSNVKTITQSGTYTMRSALEPTTEPTTLRIPRTRDAGGAVLDYWYLEMRESGGVFETYNPLDPLYGGLSIRLNDDPSQTIQSRLIDGNPVNNGWNHWDAPFRAGSTFTDGDIEVGVTSVTADEATVAITVPPPPPDTQAPTAPTGLTAARTSKGANLSWTASSDNTGVTSYVVFRDGVQIGSTTQTSYSDAAAAPGAHAYAVAAEDAAHNRSALSAPATVIVPRPAAAPAARPAAPRPARPRADRSAPRLEVTRRRDRRRRIVIRARAFDPGGVARVELLIDGRRRKSARGGSLRYVWNGRRARRGRHPAVVRATDSSGNRTSTAFRLRR